MTLAKVQRGEVWLIRYEPVGGTVGREQAGVRPGLVVSSNDFLASGADLVHVVPITSKVRPYPSRVPILPPEGGLTVPSFIICEQLRTVSIDRLISRLRVPVAASTMARVEAVLRIVLELQADAY